MEIDMENGSIEPEVPEQTNITEIERLDEQYGTVANALDKSVDIYNRVYYSVAVKLYKDVTFKQLEGVISPSEYIHLEFTDLVEHLKDSIVPRELDATLFGDMYSMYSLALSQGHVDQEGFLDRFMEFYRSNTYTSDQFYMYKSYCDIVLGKEVKFGKDIDLDRDFDVDSLEGTYKYYTEELESKKIQEKIQKKNEDIQIYWNTVLNKQNEKRVLLADRLEAILKEKATRKAKLRYKTLLGKASALAEQRFKRDLDKIRDMGWYVIDEYDGLKILVRKKPLVLDVDEFTDGRDTEFFSSCLYMGHPVIKLKIDRIEGIYLGGMAAIIGNYSSMHPHFDSIGTQIPCYGNSENQAMSLLFGVMDKHKTINNTSPSTSYGINIGAVSANLAKISLTEDDNDTDFVAHASAFMKLDKIPEWVGLIEELMENPDDENPYTHYDNENAYDIKNNWDEDSQPYEMYDLPTDVSAGMSLTVMIGMYNAMTSEERESTLDVQKQYFAQLTDTELQAYKKLKLMVEEDKNEESNNN